MALFLHEKDMKSVQIQFFVERRLQIHPGLLLNNHTLQQYFKLLHPYDCLLYTSDAADEGLGVDLGGRRIIKKKK